MNMGLQKSESLFSLLLDVHPEVELLDHTVNLCLIFWGATTLFSTAAVPFYIPTSNNILLTPLRPCYHQHLWLKISPFCSSTLFPVMLDFRDTEISNNPVDRPLWNFPPERVISHQHIAGLGEETLRSPVTEAQKKEEEPFRLPQKACGTCISSTRLHLLRDVGKGADTKPWLELPRTKPGEWGAFLEEGMRQCRTWTSQDSSLPTKEGSSSHPSPGGILGKVPISEQRMRIKGGSLRFDTQGKSPSQILRIYTCFNWSMFSLRNFKPRGRDWG